MSIDNHNALGSARPRPTGMAAFTIVWFGQIVSMLGTGMTNFALTLWAYEVTGRATPLAMLGFFYLTPIVVLAPFVGVIVDRGNRKWLMLLSDLAAACVTAGVLILYATGQLEVWHLYGTSIVLGIFQGFQWPTYSASIALMLPKKHYARANGMLEIAGSGSAVLAPVLAGALIAPLGLTGILIIDLVTAVFAIALLARTRPEGLGALTLLVVPDEAVRTKVARDALPAALDRVAALPFEAFRAQVVPFLAPEHQDMFGTRESFERMQELVIGRLLEIRG